MENNSKFIKNVKDIPLDIGVLDSEIFDLILKADKLISSAEKKEASLLILEDIFNEIVNHTNERDRIFIKMLIISEIPDIDNEIRDLSLDIMIRFEEEYSPKIGDFLKTIKKIKTRYQDIW